MLFSSRTRPFGERADHRTCWLVYLSPSLPQSISNPLGRTFLSLPPDATHFRAANLQNARAPDVPSQLLLLLRPACGLLLLVCCACTTDPQLQLASPLLIPCLCPCPCPFMVTLGPCNIEHPTIQHPTRQYEPTIHTKEPNPRTSAASPLLLPLRSFVTR